MALAHAHRRVPVDAPTCGEAVDPDAGPTSIVSLKHGEPVLRAYRIRDGVIAEMPVRWWRTTSVGVSSRGVIT